jgi:hypothetical protein
MSNDSNEASVQSVVRRRIVQASLCLRFYRSAGWTREEVRQLLREDKRLARVCPRYFDDRDKAVQGLECDDGLPHDDCDYFAVYGVLDPFAPEALALHDIA